MENEATIIVGSLDDSKIKKSIQELVQAVADGTQKMKQNFDMTIDGMLQKVRQLNNVKIDTGSANANTQQIVQQERLTQAVKTTTQTFDALANAQQNAMRPKSARDSFYAFMQGYKEQANQIAQQIRDAEAALNRAIENRVAELNQRLTAARQKFSELNSELAKQRMEAERTGNYSNFNAGITRTTQAIEYQMKRIAELQKQIADAPNMFGGQVQQIEQLRAKREQVLNTMKEEVVVQTQSTQASKQQADEQQRVTNEISRQSQAEKEAAQIERERADMIKDMARSAREYISRTGYAMPWGGRTNAYIYEENDARAKGLSIEQQIDNILKQEAQSYNNATQAANQQLEVEKQITQEHSKRSKYVTPVAGINEKFRTLVGGTLGIDVNEVRSTATSIKGLQIYLKQLTSAYESLSQFDRNQSFGKQLRESIQTTQRTIQQLRSEMSKPANMDFINSLPVRTLDEMAYKLKQLQAYKRGINLTDPKQVGEIKQVDDAIKKLSADMNKYTVSTKQANEVTNALTRSWNYMKNRMAFYLTIGASTQFFNNLIEIRSQYEMTERALGILVDSAERGTQIFKELSQMALVSPYTLIELSGAAKQLTAYDVAAKDVVDTTRRLADMASAVGVPIDRLTYALGQIKAYGYLNARDARMFANAGIPLVKQLSDYYTELEGKLVSASDVYDRIKKKAVDYNDVMSVIYKMTDEGGKFFDFQAKMADTLKVRLANLRLAWNNMLNDIGAASQGAITSGLGLLNKIFLNWKSLDKIIWNVIYTFGVFKILQVPFLMWTQKASFGLATMEVAGKRLTNVMYSLGASFKALIGNWQMLVALAAIYVAVDMVQTFRANKEAIEKLNDSLRKNAEESAKSIDSFLKSEAMVEAKVAAVNKKLTVVEGTKAWDALREEIEKSSIAAGQLVPKLLGIEDINLRVAKAFTLAESIRDAANALSNVKNELKVDQDTALWGAFGEGLAEDLQDYQDDLDFVTEKTERETKRQSGFWDALGFGIKIVGHDISEAFGNSFNEANREANEFAKGAADVIEKLLGQEGVKSSEKLAEAVARVKKEVFEANPQINSQGRMILESVIDEVFASRFQAYDKSATVTQKFLDQLKKDYGSTFANITTDILDRNEKWNKEQRDAFKATYEKLKQEIPETWSQTLDKMLDDLNSRDWTIQVMTKFNITNLSDVQKEFTKNFIESGTGAYDKQEDIDKVRAENQRRYGKLMRKDGEDNVAYEKRISDEKKKQQDIIRQNDAIYNKTKDKNSTIAKDAKEAADAGRQFLNDAKEVEKWGGYDFSTKQENAAAKKAARQAESELQKALREELSLIDKVRSSYKSLVNVGVDSASAIQTAIGGYDKTVAAINRTFGKYGLNLDLSKFAGVANPREIMNMLQTQLNTLVAQGKAKPAEIKDLEVKINTIKIDAISYDHKKITEGLNNELSKLKDEYELAVELDANPELGDVFANLFDIDLEALPHTFGEALQRANDIAKKELAKLGVNTPFDLMRTDLSGDTWMGLDTQSEPMQKLIQWQKSFRDMFKKNIEDSEKMLDDYVKKYGDYTDKIAEIEADRLERIKKLNEAYYTDEMRRRPEYIAKLNAIEQGAQREKGAVRFDEFKQSRLYVAMFENLETVSTSTLYAIRQRLEELKSEMGTLSPEQLKQVMQQFEKIDRELLQRNPFKGLIKNVKDYSKAVGRQGKQAQKDFLQAQKNYDEQLKIVTTKKEQLEQLKAAQPWNIAMRNALELQVIAEDEKLAKLKQELEAAEELNRKYDGMRMIFNEQANAIAKLLQVIAANLKSLGELRDIIQETFSADLGNEINAVVDDLTKVGDGISQAVSSLQSGDFVGATVGAIKTISGVADAIASAFGDGAARTRRINKEIANSQESVRRLQMAYENLERSIDRAMGNEELRARKLAIANKQAELAEIERQTRLERSKRSKDRDDEAIKQNEEAIQKLKNEIEDLTENITTTLLGNDIKSAAEDFVSTWVSAWRSGEDVMDALSSKFDDMIDQMIMKSLASRLVARRLQPIWDMVEQMTSEGGEGGVDITENELMRIRQLIGDKSISEAINEDLKRLYNALGIAYGSSSTTQNNLSALQQGIQGITEDQAGALEAYWNANTQQQYVHTDLLMQIRDAVVAADNDAQLGTQAQILLQLQYSYQVQTAIQNIMIGWSSANGLAVRCEMI